MLVKDYYKILEVAPHATLHEIKQAYRRLAKIYHPDKTGTDKYAVTQFNEIKEAYETLTDPGKKETYLQQRWLLQTQGRKKTAVAITPISLLQELIETERYVHQLDIHRMNQKSLKDHLEILLSNDNIKTVLSFEDAAINRQIITTALKCIKPLNETTSLLEKLRSLANGDANTLTSISVFEKRKTREFHWEKWKIPMILLLTIVIILLMYFIGQ